MRRLGPAFPKPPWGCTPAAVRPSRAPMSGRSGSRRSRSPSRRLRSRSPGCSTTAAAHCSRTRRGIAPSGRSRCRPSARGSGRTRTPGTGKRHQASTAITPMRSASSCSIRWACGKRASRRRPTRCRGRCRATSPPTPRTPSSAGPAAASGQRSATSSSMGLRIVSDGSTFISPSWVPSAPSTRSAGGSATALSTTRAPSAATSRYCCSFPGKRSCSRR
jgi:hypothetical protein